MTAEWRSATRTGISSNDNRIAVPQRGSSALTPPFFSLSVAFELGMRKQRLREKKGEQRKIEQERGRETKDEREKKREEGRERRREAEKTKVTEGERQR